MYKEYKQLDLSKTGKEILDYWKQNLVFEKSISNRPASKPYIFYEGPPSANGMPGIHHVMARSIKDIFCRYKTLKGYRVERKGGWDTHGLPVELEVEKQLGLRSKKEIEAFRAALIAEPQRYIAQPTLALSTVPTLADKGLAPRHVDFRPFVLTGAKGVQVVPGGLTRVALKPGSLVVNSSQGGGTKDSFVLLDG